VWLSKGVQSRLLCLWFSLWFSLWFGLPPLAAQLPAAGNFARTNLVAWCVVPFDSQKRGPEERAAMLDRLGVKRLAYDWRAEHIPTFDAEVAAMRKRGIELTAWWFPAALNDEAKAILACIERNKVHPQLWVTMGTEPEPDAVKLAQKLNGAVATLSPICAEAKRLGCTVALYNHLGWFGDPVNQVAIIAKLKAAGHTNVGIVYNFHHAHAHLDTFAEQLRVMQPHLVALNLNGMVRDGDKVGKKIIPLGTGDEELRLLRIINASGWRGPVGIIGHTEEDAEVKLRKELDGLEKLAPLVGQAASPSAGAPISDSARVDGNQRAGSETGAPNKVAGEPAISGREPGSQGEKDWVDNRWQETDVGPFLASNLRLPDGSVIAKALTIRTRQHNGLRVVPDSVAMVYDTLTCTLRGTWTCGSEGHLKFDPARFGLIGLPKIAGQVEFIVPPPEPADASGRRFIGIHPAMAGVVLEYEIGGSRVLEAQGVAISQGGYYLRSFEFASSSRPRTIVLFATDSPTASRVPGVDLNHIVAGLQNPFAAAIDQPVPANSTGAGTAPYLGTKSWLTAEGKQVHAGVLEVPASQTRLAIKVACWKMLPQDNPFAPHENLGRLERVKPFGVFDKLGSPGDLLRKRGTPRPTLTTRGQRGPDTDFLAVDTLTLPYDNPAKALLFASGVDFTPDGAGYICTIHGDVWRVTGIDDSLRELKWQRYATGLFQPLGLKVRDGKVFVLGRDRITRLHDENGDGEADFYENFFDGIATSTGGHDYVTSLEKDDAGNFYYIDPKGVHRVAADGSRQETLATGFRNPNGMGVRPDGKVITAAPQQGEWTPSSGLWEIRPDNVGLYGGYGGPKVSDARPLGYDAPLCWLPHAVDNSSGGQVWVPPGQWGALGGQMLHLLWGRCAMMLVLRDTTTDGIGLQGAAVPLPVKFLSGPNRGTFNPKDGHLYIAGSTGWQTSAVKDGALQRVRFTGKPLRLPVAWKARANGFEVTFSEPLDKATAEDAGSYGVKAWNYRYARQYGSKDWSVTNPEKEGRDELPVKSAKLLDDGRTVFLELAGLKPVMQGELKYNVDAREGGKAFRGSLWFTVNPAQPRR